MCLFEAEVAGLRYAVKKEGHYLVACPQITVVTDCKTLGSAYAKPLEDISQTEECRRCLWMSSMST